MTPRIETVAAKKLVGVRARMSLAQDATPALWRSFMPRRGEVVPRASTDYISLRTYETLGPKLFDPTQEFEKWATVEVVDDNNIPAGMERLVLQGGMYAVFVHNGPASDAAQTMTSIFAQWLPHSDYVLDLRPQFEVLPEGYDPMDPNAREEVYIPIRPK